MALEDIEEDRSHGSETQATQANDAAVRLALDHGKLSKILVERHHNLAVRFGVGEDRGITGVFRPVRHPFDGMPGAGKGLANLRPYTAVEEEVCP